jgi:hypothetical protein
MFGASLVLAHVFGGSLPATHAQPVTESCDWLALYGPLYQPPQQSCDSGCNVWLVCPGAPSCIKTVNQGKYDSCSIVTGVQFCTAYQFGACEGNQCFATEATITLDPAFEVPGQQVAQVTLCFPN